MTTSFKDRNAAPPRVVINAIDLLVADHQEFCLLVQGNSMLPLIRVGDLLLIRQQTDAVHQGEILTFRLGEQLVAHRVLKVYRAAQGLTGFLTKGDHSLSIDPMVSLDQVIGKVVAIRRGERQMRLDRQGWQAANRIISLVMVGLSMLSQTGEQTISPGRSGFREIMIQAGQACLALLLKTSEALFGSWET